MFSDAALLGWGDRGRGDRCIGFHRFFVRFGLGFMGLGVGAAHGGSPWLLLECALTCVGAGVDKGVRVMSDINMLLACALLLFVGSVIVGDANKRYYEGAPGRNWMAGIGANYAF